MPTNLVRRTNFDTFTTTQDYSTSLGSVVEEATAAGGTRLWRYVQFEDAVAYTAGMVCVFSDAGLTQVTNDFAGGSALADLPFAGIVNGAPTEDQFGWVCIKGLIDVNLTGTSVVGEAMTVDATPADGHAKLESGTYDQHHNARYVGVALEAVTDTVGSCYVRSFAS